MARSDVQRVLEDGVGLCEAPLNRQPRARAPG